MRLQHAFSDFGKGLRRNLSMTIAVVLTTWVSLSLFGAALLAKSQIDLMKGEWYDKIQISVFLCTKDSVGPGCSGREVTPAERDRIYQTIKSSPDTAQVFRESKQDAFKQFRELYRDSPILEIMSVEQMQQSYRVKLRDPQKYQGLRSAVSGMPGVDNVQDLRQYLDPLFQALNVLRWSALGAAGLLLMTGGLLIANTVRLAAYARRRELSIMRLIGASRFYIQLPFLLEAVMAALVGAALACGTLWAGVYFLITKRTSNSVQPTWAWIGSQETVQTSLVLLGVGIVLALIPTFLTTRRYLRV